LPKNDNYKHAEKIDDTMDKYKGAGRWQDFALTMEWRQMAGMR
jgi:hypothetical protein